MHLQAEHKKGLANAFYRESRMEGRRTVERHSFSDRTAHLCRARVRSNRLAAFHATGDGAEWRARSGGTVALYVDCH